MALKEAPITSLHRHPIKGNHLWPNLPIVPWYSKGTYLKERPVFTLDPAFHGGGYYVQEASSMLVAHYVKSWLEHHSVEVALDLCAAPGGKSTLLRSILPQETLLLCNDVIASRWRILREQMTKWGYAHVGLTNVDPKQLQKVPASVDLLLIDAPCSSEGIFRKQPEAIGEWSPQHVELCSARQKRILADAFGALKPGGLLLYSTCTFNEKENRENANWLLETFDVSSWHPEIPIDDWGMAPVELNDQGLAFQCYPHRVKGEGFFLSGFVKNGTFSDNEFRGKRSKKEMKNKKWEPLPAKDQRDIGNYFDALSDFHLIQHERGDLYAWPSTKLAQIQAFSSKLGGQWGLRVGQIKGKTLVPDHALALSLSINSKIPTIEVSKADALAYLRREPLSLPSIEKGWALIQYEGINLGWVKVLPNRINNYFPKEWRIRMKG